MPFIRPSLETLITRTAAQVAAKMGLGPLLPASVQYVLARVVAGQSHLAHGHISWAARQIMPDTAESEFLGRWAHVWDVPRKDATKATGEVTFTGTGTALIPAGTKLVRADGLQFVTDVAVNLVAGTATDVAITASATGASYNTAAGVELALVSALDGVNSPATIEADASGDGTTGGNAEETDKSLLARLLRRIRNPPHGGAPADYEAWALEVAGVTRAWTLPLWLGEGTVGLAFVRDDDTGSILPSAGEITTVRDYIEDRTRLPVTAALTVIAPTAVDLDPAITLTPNTTAVQDAVSAALEDLLERTAKVATAGATHTTPNSAIREAVSTAVGETDHVLTSPTADGVTDPGELLVLGTPVYS